MSEELPFDPTLVDKHRENTDTEDLTIERLQALTATDLERRNTLILEAPLEWLYENSNEIGNILESGSRFLSDATKDALCKKIETCLDLHRPIDFAHCGHILDILVEFGSDCEWIFADLDQTQVVAEADIFAKLDVAEKDRIKTKIVRSLPKKADALVSTLEVKQALEKLTSPEIFFLGKILDRKDQTPLRIKEIIDGINTGTQFVAPIAKRQGEMSIFRASDNTYNTNAKGERLSYRPVVFINQLDAGAAELWQKAFDRGIPVAPLCAPSAPGEDGQQLMFSRYCGPSAEILAQTGSATPILELLALYLNREVEYVATELADANIIFEDTNSGNVTVEWVDTHYYEQEMKRENNVNKITYDQRHFNFDPYEFFRNPKQWKMIIRVIDWDLAH